MVNDMTHTTELYSIFDNNCTAIHLFFHPRPQ